MHQPLTTKPHAARTQLSASGLDALLVGLVFVVYTVAVWVANELSAREALGGGVANAVPIVLFGAAARRLIIERVVERPLLVQFAGHALIGTAFCLLAYWLLIVLLGLFDGNSPTDFTVQSFVRRGMAWQLLTNASTYGAIAALAYLRAGAVAAGTTYSGAGSGEEVPGPELSRYFIRSGEEILPVDVDRIVSITGADDYAEVATLDGRHLVRMTLADFERTLDPDKFVRVHRSRIINLDRIARVEPAGGGRLLLHMEDGETVRASRAGSRLLRGRVL